MSWRKKYRDQIRAARTDSELNTIIGKIYGEGFDDGTEDVQNVDDVHDPIPWNDLD